jgi:hypothetical protein
LPPFRPGKGPRTSTLQVQPRPTPAERANERLDVEVDEALSVLAGTIENWAERFPARELALREEHDGIARLARLTQTGIDVELHHVLTFT